MLYVFKKCWCELPEDIEIIATKHVGDMQKIVSINYKVVHFLALRKFFYFIMHAINNLIFFSNATTCPLWTSWSPLRVVAEV
jgi:hypothetical protein